MYDSKKKQSAQKIKTQVLKEIKFRPNIGENDFNVKINRLKDFLSDGHKVKIRLWFKGREIVHKQLGEQLVEKIVESVSESGELDNEPKFEGKNLTMMVLPKKLRRLKNQMATQKMKSNRVQQRDSSSSLIGKLKRIKGSKHHCNVHKAQSRIRRLKESDTVDGKSIKFEKGCLCIGKYHESKNICSK